MTEPTDHRAEAEQWIALANTEGHDEQMTGVVPALLAIAHDLHRIADASDGLNRAINALMAIAGEASRIADALEPKPHPDRRYPGDCGDWNVGRTRWCGLPRGHVGDHNFGETKPTDNGATT